MFEKINLEKPIWVLKYDLWSLKGRFVPECTPGAVKFTSCHGWYKTEEDAKFAIKKFSDLYGSSYNLERVYKRDIIKS